MNRWLMVFACFVYLAGCGSGESAENNASAADNNTAECAVPVVGEFPQKARDFMRSADQIMIYSVTPGVFKEGRGITIAGLRSEVKGVFGGVELEKTKYGELIEKLGEVTEDGEPIECFEPRHVILADKGEETLRVDICFACAKIRVYESGADGFEVIAINQSNFRVLNEFLNAPLRDRDITLAIEVNDAWPE